MEKLIELFSNSGFTAVITAIATLIVTSIFALISDKKKKHQEIVMQILPERMKANSAVMESIIIVGENLRKLLLVLPENRPSLIVQYNSELQDVYDKNMLWLNKGVSDLFWELQEYLAEVAISETGDKLLKDKIENEEYFELIAAFARYRGNIQSRMRLLSGFPLLDKTLGEMAVIKPKRRFFSKPKRELSQ